MGAVRGGASSLARAPQAAAVLLLVCLASLTGAAAESPTPEEYLTRSGATAKLVEPGELEFDGRPARSLELLAHARSGPRKGFVSRSSPSVVTGPWPGRTMVSGG